MRALVLVEPGRLVLRQQPTPVPGPGQVRIRTAACAICATDLEMIDGSDRSFYPSVLGHEWSGVVDAFGDSADRELLGVPCVAENALEGGCEVGFECSGGYGEYFVTETANIHPLPEDFPLVPAALIEPLAVAVRGVNKLRSEDASRALIIGDGPIGLMCTCLLRQDGVGEIVLVGGRAGRLRLAADLGASHVHNYHHDDGKGLRPLISAESSSGFPVVIEASGSASGIELALDVADRCGQILVIGVYGEARAGFLWNHLLHRELELIGSNASAGAWSEAVRLAVSGTVPLDRFVTRVFPVSRWRDAFDVVRSCAPDVVKVVLDWSATG